MVRAIAAAAAAASGLPLNPTGWHQAIARCHTHAQRRRKLGRLHRKGLLPAHALTHRHTGMFGYVKETNPADRVLVERWLREHGRAP
jgi:hypothetical protein